MVDNGDLVHRMFSTLYESMVIPASPRLFGDTGFEKAPEDGDIQARLEQIKQYSQAHPTHRTAKVWGVVTDFFGGTKLLNMTTLGGDQLSIPVSSEVLARIHPQITAVGGEGYTGTLHDLYPTNFGSNEQKIIHIECRTHAENQLGIKDQDGFTLGPDTENGDYIFLYNDPLEEEELAAAAP